MKTKSRFEYLQSGSVSLADPVSVDRNEWPICDIIIREGIVSAMSGADVGLKIGQQAGDIDERLVQVYRSGMIVNLPGDIFKIAVSGHRPPKLGGYGKNPLSDWVSSQLKSSLEAFILKHENIALYTGMAQGADQKAAFEAAMLRRAYPGRVIRIIAAVPSPQQPERWPQAAKDHWKHILDNYADEVHLTASEHSPWVNFHRNRFIVSNCQLLIAVWDGSDGGTKHAVDEAMRSRQPIWRINPKNKTSELLHYDAPDKPEKKKQSPHTQLKLF